MSDYIQPIFMDDLGATDHDIMTAGVDNHGGIVDTDTTLEPSTSPFPAAGSTERVSESTNPYGIDQAFLEPFMMFTHSRQISQEPSSAALLVEHMRTRYEILGLTPYEISYYEENGRMPTLDLPGIHDIYNYSNGEGIAPRCPGNCSRHRAEASGMGGNDKKCVDHPSTAFGMYTNVIRFFRRLLKGVAPPTLTPAVDPRDEQSVSSAETPPVGVAGRTVDSLPAYPGERAWAYRKLILTIAKGCEYNRDPFGDSARTRRRLSRNTTTSRGARSVAGRSTNSFDDARDTTYPRFTVGHTAAELKFIAELKRFLKIKEVPMGVQFVNQERPLFSPGPGSRVQNLKEQEPKSKVSERFTWLTAFVWRRPFQSLAALCKKFTG